MIALLDTNAFLFWVNEPDKLSRTAYEFIGDGDNRLIMSAVCGWEIAIKASLKKIKLPEPAPLFVNKYCQLNAFETLTISMRHGLHVYELPRLHKDPFDRLLVAQSLLEGVPIVTSDPLIMQYKVKVIW
jgi:PIN domain nuclease of toxin-antitoxin system